MGDFVMKEGFRKKLRILLGDTEAEKVIKKLVYEDLMVKGRNATNKGSSTFGNAQSSKSVGENVEALTDLFMAAKGNPQSLQKAGKGIAGRINEFADTSNKQGYRLLSEVMFDADKSEPFLDWYIAELTKEQSKTARRLGAASVGTRATTRSTSNRSSE
jgi:hypothetical protein